MDEDVGVEAVPRRIKKRKSKRQGRSKSNHVLEEIKEEAETPRDAVPLEDSNGREGSSERSKNPKSLQ